MWSDIIIIKLLIENYNFKKKKKRKKNEQKENDHDDDGHITTTVTCDNIALLCNFESVNLLI